MQGNPNQSGNLSTAEAYLKEYNESVTYIPMSEDQARLLLTITVAGDSPDLKKELSEYVTNCQSCLIMKARFKLMGVDADDQLLVMLSSFIDRAGLAVISVIDILNVLHGAKEAKFKHFIDAYPMGYYNVKDEAMMIKIIDLCKERKVNFSEIY